MSHIAAAALCYISNNVQKDICSHIACKQLHLSIRV